MLILPSRASIRPPALWAEGAEPIIRRRRQAPLIERYQPQPGAVPRPWLVHGTDISGRSCWRGRFRSRDEAEFFIAVANLGLLRRDPDLWRMPQPWWDPDSAALIYQFAVSVVDDGSAQSTTGSAIHLTSSHPGGIPAGALICVGVTEQSVSGSETLDDDVNNTYTSITLRNINNVAANGFTEAFYCPNCKAVSLARAINYNKSVPGNTATMSVFHATGIITSSPLDTGCTNSTAGNSASPSVTSGTPSQSGNLMVAQLGSTAGRTFSQDTGNGWAAPYTPFGTGVDVDGGNLINAGSSAKTFSPTFNASSTWAALIYGFLAVATPVRVSYNPWPQNGPLLAQ